MKNAKKIVVSLLALALLISCMGIASLADEPAFPENAAQYDKILEYFETPVFFSSPFDYETVDEATADLTELTEAGSNFEVTDVTGSTVAFKVKQPTRFSAAVEESATYRVVFRARAQYSSSRSKSSVKMQYKYEGGIVSVDAVNIAPANSTSPSAPYAKNEWYIVEAVFSPAQVTVNGDLCDGYLLNLTSYDDQHQVVETIVDREIPALLTEISLLCPISQSSTVSFDYLNVYAGSFFRNAADYSGEVDALLVSLINDYDAADTDAEKMYILETMDKVTSPQVHGYVPVSAEAQAAVARKNTLIIHYYVEQLIDAVAAIDKTASYADRAAHCAQISVYNTPIPDDYSGENATAVLAAKATYADELSDLAFLKAQSEQFIAAMAGVDPTGVYSSLESSYNAVGALAPDLTYEGVAEAYELYTVLAERFLAMKTRAETFKEMAAIAANESFSFAKRYAAYVTATENYFDDTTCDGIAEALVAYASASVLVAQASGSAEQFITLVSKAATSTYYSATLNYLGDAALLIEVVESSYPGVSEAMEQYARLRELLAVQAVDVAAYIDAVNAIDFENMTFLQLMAAVDTALALQKKGSIDGFEGVGEANIKLSNAEKNVKAPEGFSRALIRAVADAKNAATSGERYAALCLALAVRDSVERSYEGVAAALADLQIEVANYNAIVSDTNDAFTAVTKNALEMSATVAPQGAVKQVVAILKKVFDN